MKKWKANKLPIIGCPSCLGDTTVLGEKCPNCSGWGFFPVKKSSSVNISTINSKIAKTILHGNTN